MSWEVSSLIINMQLLMTIDQRPLINGHKETIAEEAGRVKVLSAQRKRANRPLLILKVMFVNTVIS